MNIKMQTTGAVLPIGPGLPSVVIQFLSWLSWRTNLPSVLLRFVSLQGRQG